MNTRSLPILLTMAAGLLAPAAQSAPSSDRCVGVFPFARHRIEVTRANLAAAVADAKRRGHSRTMRVAALVDSRFEPSALREFGWRMITRIGSVVTLEGEERSARYLTAVPGITYVKMPDALRPSMDSARKFCRVDEVLDNTGKNLPHGFAGTGVLVGIFDTEFDTHHPAFLDANGETRFVALWDQRDTTHPNQNRFGYGVIKNHAGLEADTAFGQKGSPHGTLMASYAVGGERTRPYYGVAPQARILAVQYAGTDVELIDAISWTFSIADSLAVPCVINMSIGVAMGPHDGTSLLDRGLDSLSGAGRIVVGAMGNDGDKKAHIAFPLARNETRGVYATPNVWAQPGDTGASTAVDLWGEQGKVFSVNCRVLDTATLQYQQGSQSVATVGSGWYEPDTFYWHDNTTGRNDTCILQIGIEQSSALNRKAHAQIYYITTNPRLFLGVRVSVPSYGQACTVHGWNHAKLAFRGFGLQGFYDGDGAYSVNEVGGTAKRIIAVGGYVNKVSYTTWDGGPVSHPQNGPARDLAVWSSRGPTVDGRIVPHITAPGSNVVGAMGCTGTDPGGFTILWPDNPSVRGRYGIGTGTSVSSPIVAGIIALMLQADPSLTPEEARQVLQETAITDELTGPLPTPDTAWGAGKADALAAVCKVLGVPTRAPRTVRQEPARPGVTIDGRGVLRFTGPWERAAVRVELFDGTGRCIFTRATAAASSLRLPARLTAGVHAVRIFSSGRLVHRAAFVVNHPPD